MNADELAKMFKRRLKGAALSGIYSPHSCRMAVATDLLDQDADIHHVADLLGHRSTRTTQLYNRNQGKVKENLVERIRQQMVKDA